jgi:hypothetical protein
MLRHHRASFHDEAALFLGVVLADLPDADVSPATAIDVARLEEDGRFVIIEACSPRTHSSLFRD